MCLTAACTLLLAKSVLRNAFLMRQNTRLESEGAEFLVLGNLLIQGIPAYKAYQNMTGYDIVATNPDQKSIAMIQVKSRWRTKARGFIINNFDCDFVIVVKLNRGSQDGTDEILPPEYYIFPVAYVKSLPRSENWGNIPFRNIPEIETYKDRWELITRFLKRRVT
jgi:hypothetical protein